MIRVVAIVGPTAVGKSRLALLLAQELGGEIVNADSRQVYRYMDIGTAKPRPEERASVPHHLYDVVDPDQEFNVAIYLNLAKQTLEDIGRRGKLAFIVGGSGLYVWSLLEGWQLPGVPPQPELRRRLEARAKVEGIESLHDELRRIDPQAAEKIDPCNLRRVIRALEVYHITGRRFSELGQRQPPSFARLIIGLTTERADLYHRIDSRVDQMMEQGLVAEVQGLMQRGYSLDLPSMSGLGYRQIGLYLSGKLDLPAAIQQLKFETHRFARQQYAWFRLSDQRIKWLDVRGEYQQIAHKMAEQFLNEDHNIVSNLSND